MVDAFVGKFKLDTSENFDEFMKALGVNMALRKVGGVTKPTMTISKDGDSITFSSESTFKNYKATFKLGEEYEDTSPDGRKCKNTHTLVGGKIVQKESPVSGDGPSVTYEREIDGNGDLVVVCTTGTVSCKRIYKKC